MIGNGYASLQISCGKDHYMALSADGKVYVWGRNDSSQLGLGHKLDVETPKVVDISGRSVDNLTLYHKVLCGIVVV